MDGPVRSGSTTNQFHYLLSPKTISHLKLFVPQFLAMASQRLHTRRVCIKLLLVIFNKNFFHKGFNLKGAASIFVKLMKRLNHDKFFVHGGDWGAGISKTIATLYPQK